MQRILNAVKMTCMNYSTFWDKQFDLLRNLFDLLRNLFDFLELSFLGRLLPQEMAGTKKSS